MPSNETFAASWMSPGAAADWIRPRFRQKSLGAEPATARTPGIEQAGQTVGTPIREWMTRERDGNRAGRGARRLSRSETGSVRRGVDVTVPLGRRPGSSGFPKRIGDIGQQLP